MASMTDTELLDALDQCVAGKEWVIDASRGITLLDVPADRHPVSFRDVAEMFVAQHKREPGFYWVREKHCDKWEAAEWVLTSWGWMWSRTGVDTHCDDFMFERIGSRAT